MNITRVTASHQRSKALTLTPRTKTLTLGVHVLGWLSDALGDSQKHPEIPGHNFKIQLHYAVWPASHASPRGMFHSGNDRS
jgi:hypothetical protein